jgi:hypothetical protein
VVVVPNATTELLSCKVLSTLAAGKIQKYNTKYRTVHDKMEITDGEQCQNSVLWRAFERHGQIADFLLLILFLV